MNCHADTRTHSLHTHRDNRRNGDCIKCTFTVVYATLVPSACIINTAKREGEPAWLASTPVKASSLLQKENEELRGSVSNDEPVLRLSGGGKC